MGWTSTRRGAAAILATSLLSSSAMSARSDDGLLKAARDGDTRSVRALLAQRADANVAEPDGTTPLAWAAYRDDASAADALIAAGADTNKANDYGVTPLWLACSNGSAPMIARLLKGGADPNVTLWSGETVLMTCARAGTLPGVKALLARGAAVNTSEPQRGQTALMWAVAAGHADVARALIAKGASVHARSHPRAGSKPMVFATWGRDVVASSQGGFTPLLFAAQQGDVASAEVLLAAGAKVNDVGPEGMTPLILAAASGHENVALALLRAGASPLHADASGATALHYALRDGLKIIHEISDKADLQEIHSTDPEVIKRLSQLVLVSSTQKPSSPILPGGNMHALVKELLARGANPNAGLREVPAMLRLQRRPKISLLNATPFLLASITGDTVSAKMLVEKGADPRAGTRVDERQMLKGYSDDAQIQGNATPLMVAAGLGRDGLDAQEKAAALEAVRLALSLGADVNAAGVTGWTALHAAAYAGADAVVELLVARGARIDVQNGCGQTPLTLAQGDDARGLLKRTKVQTTTVTLLKKLGAGTSKPAGPVGKCIEGRWGI